MATHGRSLDDLPLAAYSTGAAPDEPLDAPAAEVEPPAAEPPAAGPARVPPGPAFVKVDSTPHELSADLEGMAAPPRAAPVDQPPVARVVGLARRNPRLAAGAGFITIIAVGGLLLLGGSQTPASLAASASPTVPPVAVVLPPTGDATLVLSGAAQGSYTFGGGARDAAKSAAFSATWTDAAQNSLALDAKVDRGTRTTDDGLVLRLTVAIEGTPVTFTSKAGECTIGMGIQPTTVSGSFTCKKLKSDDGTLTVEATGTYRT
jgi:hypothetical protein